MKFIIEFAMYYKLPLDKLPYLNVGCGKKYNPNWVNVDMVAAGPDVMEVNLVKGIPFPTNSFDLVYHSQVLEHIPKNVAPYFLQECFRVLKPGGVLRVVCPDLEDITREYLKWLEQSVNQPTELSKANYDWIILELLDQIVRTTSGGAVAEYLQKDMLINQDYVFGRTGYIGRQIRERFVQRTRKSWRDEARKPGFLKKAWREVSNRLFNILSTERCRVGRFRLGGEVHQWMYDRYSLGQLLGACGFVEIQKVDEITSSIPDWASHELDVRKGLVMDPNSLFMEARKPFF